MAEEGQFKRNIAYKLKIGDILLGKPIIDNERFSFLELGDKRIVRVNIIGNIVDKYESDGERKYIFFKLDDGSGQISLKVFGDDIEKFKEINQGLTVLVIGTLRHWNNETYIQPEIIKEQNTKYLLVRKLELEKGGDSMKKALPMERSKIVAIKDSIINLIKEAEENGGIEKEQIILKLKETSPDIINQEIKKFLEEGIIFEPRPGKVRYLG
ncbi:MAG: OB-fold nucleic acid binding domain protein [Candidatus Diapherotrites archaeon ADurb.Bin253]|nr:MAG: OB-fold nucleic acid binding domain protein [Candidatus Diapherotrites archaeon ADurb.Bin253]HNZ52190.1 OB-fold nucleic acid binding domain-containing protein [Candidatus Pacearchaeota archaeon]HOC97203.1 OB-fold nucleic acid binding domain-containing protein [Candidatus Pacearchaeota archaeon]HOH04303.1 OB-fold nucleic acid binding domain-containing protein [Candidatus Pacearchaeota archaeon]HPX74531.1 OB-fold nucleic acid binding domain-containing protein [Candidatus Pacearchaeota arc